MTLEVDDEPASPTPGAPCGDDAPHEPNVLVHRGFIRAMIALVVILVLGMVTLIVFRAQSVEEPTSAVLVVGDQYLQGAQIIVYSEGREIVKTSIDSTDNWSTPVLLMPGPYEVAATIHDEELIRRPVTLPSMRMHTLDLPTSIVVQADSSLAGAEVTLSGGEPYRRDVLTVDSDGNVTTYRPAGSYHLTLAHEGKVLRDIQFTLVAHQPMVFHPFSRFEAEAVGTGAQ